MQEKFLKALKDYNMLSTNRVIVALSGGADSVSLLHAFLEVKNRFGLEIYAAHLNHMLRGSESERDENFVRQLCENAGVRLFCERADINAECKKTGESTELAARRIRYEFFERIAKGCVVATAHTASDSAETVILNLVRGSAAKGLCGIPPVRGIFIRPLIYCTRDDIENYCRKNNIEYVQDSSNFTDDYTRNKIRHNIMPLLKDINPAFENTITKNSRILSLEYDYLERSAAKLYAQCKMGEELKTEILKTAHPALIKKVIKIYLTDFGAQDISCTNIDDVFDCVLKGSGKTVLHKKITIEVSRGALRILKSGAPTPEFSTEIRVVDREEFEKLEKVNTLLLKNAFDYDKITGELCVRTRISGDAIRLNKRGVTKTLKKLYTELSIPQNMRAHLPVIADDIGPIWVYGAGISERVAIDNSTKNFSIVYSQINREK